MKKKIADGTFTPCVTNSYTRKGIYSYDDVKFRSSWEFLFFIYYKKVKNITLEYETIRIPYMYENKKHSYIVDFKLDNTLIEIKPECYNTDTKVITKQEAAIEYCKDKNLTFYMIQNKIISKMKEKLIKMNIIKENLELICK
jgi:hypothetical protein